MKAVTYEGTRKRSVTNNLRDLIVNGRAKPSKLVSHHINIDQAPNAYDKFDQRVDGYTKD